MYAEIDETFGLYDRWLKIVAQVWKTGNRAIDFGRALMLCANWPCRMIRTGVLGKPEFTKTDS